MFKYLVFCVLLWHKIYEINGHAVAASTDSGEQAQLKEVHSLHAALLNGSLIERTSLSSSFNSTGEELVTDYVMAEETGVFKVHRVRLTWNGARQICIDVGGHLAIIRSQSEADVVKELMVKAMLEEAWVGLHDQFEEGEWTSVLDEPLAETGWAYWSTNFTPNPDNKHGNQNCARIMANDGGLVDEDCNSSRPFVCKRSSW